MLWIHLTRVLEHRTHREFFREEPQYENAKIDVSDFSYIKLKEFNTDRENAKRDVLDFSYIKLKEFNTDRELSRTEKPNTRIRTRTSFSTLN